jgi:ATP-dependent RNA helicase RhlE
VPLAAQQRRLAAGVDILVATPGRLLALIDRGALTLSHVETLALDEADRMLDLGFIHAVKRIAKLLPRRRQILLFSATMPSAIAALARHGALGAARLPSTPSTNARNAATPPSAHHGAARQPTRSSSAPRRRNDTRAHDGTPAFLGRREGHLPRPHRRARRVNRTAAN